MEFDPGLYVELLARTATLWWVILPAILLGLVLSERFRNFHRFVHCC